jgi:hypothetical protein
VAEEDIFASWKNARFVVIDPSLFGRWSIILTDFEFWTREYDSLVEWCEHYGGTISGMTVEFPSEETLTLFVLTWS